jgi:hypothetical protein
VYKRKVVRIKYDMRIDGHLEAQLLATKAAWQAKGTPPVS